MDVSPLRMLGLEVRKKMRDRITAYEETLQKLHISPKITKIDDIIVKCVPAYEWPCLVNVTDVLVGPVVQLPYALHPNVQGEGRCEHGGVQYEWTRGRLEWRFALQLSKGSSADIARLLSEMEPCRMRSALDELDIMIPEGEIGERGHLAEELILRWRRIKSMPTSVLGQMFQGYELFETKPPVSTLAEFCQSEARWKIDSFDVVTPVGIPLINNTKLMPREWCTVDGVFIHSGTTYSYESEGIARALGVQIQREEDCVAADFSNARASIMSECKKLQEALTTEETHPPVVSNYPGEYLILSDKSSSRDSSGSSTSSESSETSSSDSDS
jgi:hypothetical protein